MIKLLLRGGVTRVANMAWKLTESAL